MDRTLEAHLVSLDFARYFTNAMLDSIPEDKMCYQPVPDCNHALWVMGHLACTDEFFMQVCGGPWDQRFEQHKGTFFMGSKPVADPAVYGSPADIRAWLQDARTRMIDWLKGQTAEELTTPLPEFLQRAAADRMKLVPRLAVHESAHAGQLTVIRKSLGLAPVFA